ncbi:MAG: RusA family crossover junction endodeoxyribonuclease [Alphaproteobacteria bacterium]|nr:RusA family crossover junction endodeoxyribonuclease [Alphaproteobacteria bacterium]
MAIPKSWTKTRQNKTRDGGARPTTSPDVDNIAKLALDSMNGIIFIDDRQVCSMKIEKHYGDAPCTVVRVSEIDAAT